MTVLAILQARMSSSRLPGKVMADLLGEPMLARQVERLRRCRRLDTLLVATSTEAADDALVDLCARIGVDCFRGSLDDVLDRFHAAASGSGAEQIVRLTADCPLADPDLIDALVAMHVAGGYDYSCNTLTPRWPDGLDAEAMRAEVLEAAWREAALPSEREHVTRFIYTRPERFRLGSLVGETDLSDQRWTVDTPEDLALVRAVYAALYPKNPAFGTGDILQFLAAHPEIAALNRVHRRNEGLERSLAQDAAARQDLARS
ncbi:cytidylyltransferase domain-containing protein [Inquilinus sp. Marseille-Q2685]|uniref:cytidylyltransferase domain-containing protein n=1 Tax=Inquilinus sp. Marseille-Q2685 TaxID=2866581 RepID=UPI001CE43E90|nr:glycosyltransferase family protein [Inquilinus sp. Marseille-Q2685]